MELTAAIADKKPVKIEDVWRRLEAAAARHEIHWRWVKGPCNDGGCGVEGAG